MQTFHTSYHTLHNIIQQLLRQFIPFLCECTDEGLLVCRRIVSDQPLCALPVSASPTHFQEWGLDLENALAIAETLNITVRGDNNPGTQSVR
ncbi:hypothetical protein TNCV_1384281 [Trichonephila clavipes]|nr:hypothetical protein TNCV_1384281 [Trichonephila clavipes]